MRSLKGIGNKIYFGLGTKVAQACLEGNRTNLNYHGRALSAMTATSSEPKGTSFISRIFLYGISIFGGTTVGVTLANSGDFTQTLFDFSELSIPILHLLDPETAHGIGISLAKTGLVPMDNRPEDPSLHTSVWGKEFKNPLGLAAGFDKNAEAMEAMFGIGFGFVEVGSVTPKPQEGNQKPRIFRLPEQKAIINRCGCNSEGCDAISRSLEGYRTRNESSNQKILGVNIAKNRTSSDPVEDYVEACRKLAVYADYLVVNVSSPNTPGLRKLQASKELIKIVKAMKKTLEEVAPGTPLLVKVAPDLTSADMQDIAKAVVSQKVDGLIVSNTSVSRPPDVLSTSNGEEIGGLSGRPLNEVSTALIGEMYRLTEGKIPIIGCGGVSDGTDVYNKIKAGASLVQLYTGLTYGGPAIVPRIKRELSELLRADGHSSVKDAVGINHSL